MFQVFALDARRVLAVCKCFDLRPFSMGLMLVTVLCFCGLVQGAVIFSENFDGLTPGPAMTSVGGFTTLGGTDVDITGGLHGSFFPALCVGPESGNCLDLGGSGPNPQGQIRSNMQFAAGTYLLSFNLIGTQRGNTASTTVTFGDYNHQFTLPSSDVVGGNVLNQLVTLSAPGFLMFVNNTPGFQGDVLDNVIVSTPGTVPEPASLVLVGCGLLAVMMRKGRRSSPWGRHRQGLRSS